MSLALLGVGKTAAAPPAAFACDAADFDGTNDYLSRNGLTGETAGKTLTVSFWVKIENADSSNIRFLAGTGGKSQNTLIDRLATSKKIQVSFEQDASTTDGLNFTTSATVEDDGNWHHIAFSVDMADTAKRKVYIDGTQDSSVTWTTYLNGNLDRTMTWTLGATSGGLSKLDGGLAEFFMAFTYTDLASTITNFRNASTGKPVDLGADGSTPLGVQPIVYLHLDDGEAAANFAVNAGSGGNFTVTGALSTFASSPTD